MTLLTRVRGLIHDDSREDRIYECRHCGTMLESDREECPICGNRGIASYDLE
jgi:rubrerythrin